MQIFLSPEIEAIVQRQLTSGKYQDALAVIAAGIQLLEQQEQEYLERLPELREAAEVGWQASRQGQVVDGPTAMAQILSDLKSRHDASPHP
jgi:antitoxin ParD1/3/4